MCYIASKCVKLNQLGKKINTSTEIHQGELLKAIFDWSGRTSQEEFVKPLKLSRSWLIRAMKWERIPNKYLEKLNDKYSIPIEYWSGEAELPRKDIRIASEPAPEYGYKEKYYKLLEIHDELKSKYIKLLEANSAPNE